MSVSKSRDTNTYLRSERTSFYRFLILYALLVALLVGAGGYLYYQSQEKLAFSAYRIQLMEYAAEQTRRLRYVHEHFPAVSLYPVDERFESAIWDLEYTQIFSTLHHQRVHLDEEIYRTGDRIHLIKILDTYYLGAKYLVIEVPEESEWQIQVWRTLAVYGGVGFVILMGFGWLLARLFVRPMRRSILLLDRFIRDTTHELNTPLSTMLANIETMEPEHLSPANARRLRRIDAAARTVSTLYEDLKFVTLESGKTPEDVPIDMAVLVEGRLEYFSVLIESKQLQLQTDLVPASVVADRRLIERVVDNLLSNAIKYNRRGGAIRVRVRPDELVVADTGVGIAPEDMPRIFDRYARFNESEGGFGIGLSIVRRIVDHYGMSIHVASEPGRGTTMTLRWRPTE